VFISEKRRFSLYGKREREKGPGRRRIGLRKGGLGVRKDISFTHSGLPGCRDVVNGDP